MAKRLNDDKGSGGNNRWKIIMIVLAAVAAFSLTVLIGTQMRF